MSANVLSFWRARPAAAPCDWTQSELAQFYRVEAALMRAGLHVETERGLSDEGDPWFAFCRTEDGEVAIHFARIDGEYIVAGMMGRLLARGRDFDALIGTIISRHPAVRPDAEKGNNVVMHPAMWLVALVAAALLKVSDARADEKSAIGEDTDRGEKRGASHGASTMTGTASSNAQNGASNLSGGAVYSAVFEPAHVAAIVAAAGFALADTGFGKAALSASAGANGTKAEKIFDPAAYMSSSSPAQASSHVETSLPHLHDTETMSHGSVGIGEAATAKLLSLLAVLWTTPNVGGVAPSEISIASAVTMLDLTSPLQGTNAAVDMAVTHDHVFTTAGLIQFTAPHESVHDNAAQAPAPTSAAPQKSASAPSKPASSSSSSSGTDSSGGATKSASASEQQKPEPVLVVEVTKTTGQTGSGLPEIVALKVALAEGGSDRAEASVVKFDKLPADVAKLIGSFKAPEPVQTTPAPAEHGKPQGNTSPAASAEDKLVTKVLEAVASFKAATPDYKLSLEGNHFVYYDLDAVLHHGPKVQSETWTFSDGSTVSLVGLNLGHHDATI